MTVTQDLGYLLASRYLFTITVTIGADTNFVLLPEKRPAEMLSITQSRGLQKSLVRAGRILHRDLGVLFNHWMEACLVGAEADPEYGMENGVALWQVWRKEASDNEEQRRKKTDSGAQAGKRFGTVRSISGLPKQNREHRNQRVVPAIAADRTGLPVHMHRP